jgi:signal transduction histidine kinase
MEAQEKEGNIESIKSELLLITNTFWQALADRDIEKRFLQCADSITFIGTGLDEKASGKAAYYAINKKGIEQYPEKFKLSILWERASVIEDIGWVENETEWTQMINGKEEKTLIRNTIVLKKTEGKWWIVHVHGSVPDFRLSGQNYITNAETIKINRELESEVCQRTKELKQKNKELEIESSLEKVRTVAMSMRKPDDMLDVCRMISDQLEILGVHEIRNVQTAIIDESGNGTYMNYQYFTQYKDETIELVQSAKHPKVAEMIQRMQQAPDAFFKHSFDGDALEEWKQYRRDDHQFADPILEKSSAVHFYFYSIGQGGLGLSAYSPLNEEDINVLHRFRNVFVLVYQRFRDIEKAAAQAKEVQIELALERVRARTMGMQHSDELQDAAILLFDQMKGLGVHTGSCGFAIWNKKEKTATVWMSSPEGGLQTAFELPHTEAAVYLQVYEAMNKGDVFLVKEVAGNHLIKHFDYLCTLPGIGDVIKQLRKSGYQFPETIVFHFAFFAQGYLSFHLHEHHPETHEIFKRFAKVFEQTYTRFLDLQKAEEQAREAQIELGLERVRARTMAMQRSDELSETAYILFQQFTALGESPLQITIGIVHEEERYIEFRVTDWAGGGLQVNRGFNASIDEPTLIYKMFTAWKGQQKSVVIDLAGKELEDWVKYRNTISGVRVSSADTKGRRVITCAIFSRGHISFSSPEPRPKETTQLLERFAGVFDQTYTRFLDLQKSEAQAKEAQIETALERIRSRTMGMQKSEELKDVIQLVYDQFVHIKIDIEHTGFILDYKAREDMHIWLADQHEVPSEVFIPYFDTAHWNSFLEAKEKGLHFFANHLPFEEKNKFYQTLFEMIPGVPEETKVYYQNCPGLAISTVLLDNVGLYIENFSGIPYTDQENKTLLRFGKVFQQTYTRFLDLQKSEAQTRKAQIETALERVRSRTMAMQNSSELGTVAAELFAQMNQLVTNLWTCGFVLCEKDRDEDEWWLSMDGDFTRGFFLPNVGNYAHATLFEGWLKLETFRAVQLDGGSLQQHYDWLMGMPVSRAIFDAMDAAGLARPDWQKLHAAYFSKGYLVLITREPCGEQEIFKRFAQVFDQTYTRFLDLQNAEAQTQKVRIEVAMERVRARALAMQKPEELIEVAQVMRHEMGLLGVEELETSSIYIHGTNSDMADCWYAIKDIQAPEKKLVADHITIELRKTWVGRQMLDFFNSKEEQVSIVMQGANRIEWINYCSSISDVLDGFYGKVIPDRTYHLYKFSNGALGAAAEADISEESWELLRRATSVFSLAYSRFKDLTQARVDLQRLKTEKQRAEEALAHLKAVQTQLIQSEKMASLGELTAGIAHEIQNPLNFVNNFSEVNTELIDEMKEELAIGNTKSAINIAEDIKENQIKITDHGKRADAIVKGMLQHSRSSSGVKEPTDINALADEYLRLAYHGLRAKDKSFNATMKTDFDPNIGLVNVIPQDIGRVILNLITNAFYAVSAPKSPIGDLPYEPTVTVRTKQLHPLSGGRGSEGSTYKVEISISDNGPGIPTSVLDKIFQPFFTTKPTGQGTGLGLSLSYDIVKAHGGELKVETKEGEGTTFIIQLPIVNS